MKKKKAALVAVIIFLVILLTPVPMHLKDGGSVRYKAIAYEVTKIHKLTLNTDNENSYIDGIEIKLFGITVLRQTDE